MHPMALPSAPAAAAAALLVALDELLAEQRREMQAWRLAGSSPPIVFDRHIQTFRHWQDTYIHFHPAYVAGTSPL